MTKLPKLPPPPPEAIAKAQYVDPKQSRRPKGYFDALKPLTKEMLNRKVNLGIIADHMITTGAMPPADRKYFLLAMNTYFSRCRQADASTLKDLAWRKAILGGGIHIATPEGKTLCGYQASAWAEWDGSDRYSRCTRCLGTATRSNATVTE